MRFQRILEQVYCRPWFITAEGHDAVRQLVAMKVARAEWDFSDFVQQRQPLQIDANGIAHIHILGVLGQGLLPIEKSCGATDYDDVAGEVAQATQAGARGFFFRVDSGGGMCEGCIECARVISAIDKPKVAHTRTLIGSAAYALAVGCDQIYCTPSAMVGSIGTILPWVDSSGRWAAMGLEFRPITSEGADLKSTGHGPSLTPEQEAYLQELANDYGAQFTGHVRANREPAEEVFRAGCYVGPRALQYGLVDGLASEAQALQTLIATIAAPPVS